MDFIASHYRSYTTVWTIVSVDNSREPIKELEDFLGMGRNTSVRFPWCLCLAYLLRRETTYKLTEHGITAMSTERLRLRDGGNKVLDKSSE